MIALYIVLGVLALLLVLFCVRINCVFAAGFSNKNGAYVELYIKYLFFKANILPAEEKAAEEADKAEEAKEDKNKKDEPEKEKQPLSVQALYRIFIALSERVSNLLSFIVSRSVTIRNFELEASVGTSDPMMTGLAIGGANAFVYGLLAVLDRNMKLKNFTVDISPDWNTELIRGGLSLVIHTNILNILTICFKAAMILIRARSLMKRVGKD